MWKGKQKRIRSSVLLCTSTLESWTEVLTASTCSEPRDIIIQYGQTDGTPSGSKTVHLFILQYFKLNRKALLLMLFGSMLSNTISSMSLPMT